MYLVVLKQKKRRLTIGHTTRSVSLFSCYLKRNKMNKTDFVQFISLCLSIIKLLWVRVYPLYCKWWKYFIRICSEKLDHIIFTRLGSYLGGWRLNLGDRLLFFHSLHGTNPVGNRRYFYFWKDIGVFIFIHLLLWNQLEHKYVYLTYWFY